MTSYSLVGTEISKILRLFLINANEECLCKKRAQLLDELGVRWARSHVETIVDWLEEESHVRGGLQGMAFSRIVGRRLVYSAIRQAEPKWLKESRQKERERETAKGRRKRRNECSSNLSTYATQL